MSNLIQINSFANKFSPNLLGIGSSFTDINQIYNITSGTGTLQFGTAKEYGYFADVSNNSFTTTDFVFNFGNTLKSNIYYSDNYIFQMSLIDFVSGPNSFLPFDFEVLIYKDGVNTDTLSLNFDLNSVVFDGKVATFSQSIFISGTVNVVDFAFKIIHNPSALNSNLDFRFGNLKLERDDKFLGLPTPYSLPIDYYTNPTTGWAYYVDSLVTPTITIGTTYTQISIDALGATINDYLPLEIRGTSQLWAGSKITPISIGDDYDGRFDVTITAKSGTPTLIELIIDISGGVAGTNVAFTGYIQTGGTIPYKQSIDLDYFSLATFVANGGKLYAKVDSGTVTIGRRNIKISRKSKAF